MFGLALALSALVAVVCVLKLIQFTYNTYMACCNKLKEYARRRNEEVEDGEDVGRRDNNQMV